MLASRGQTYVRILLSAMLLLSGTSTPGVQHAHAGGGKPHHHESLLHHTIVEWGGEYLHHGCRHTASGEAVAHDCELFDCVRHVHFSWLGFDFILPASSGPTGPTNDSGTTALAMVRSLGADEVAVLRPTVSPLYVWAILDSPSAHQAVEVSLADRFSCVMAVSAPLCDSARHERSGVQLA